MTWRVGGFGGGETRDALIEGLRGYAFDTPLPILFDTDGMDIISDPVKNGTGALRILAGEGGFAYLLPAASDLRCLQAWVNYDGNPTAIHTIFNGGGIYLQVNTSRQVRIATTPNYVDWKPLTPWSVNVLGNGTWTHLAWFIDYLTMPFLGGIGTVLIDGVVQFTAVKDGGGSLDALVEVNAGNAGVDIRLDDICGLHSTDPNDAPHITPAPIAKVCAQHPNAEGALSQWTRLPASGTWWSKWADAAGNDGDTTALYTATAGAYQDSDFQSSADLSWGVGAVLLENAAGVGPVWSIVHKTAGGTKFSALTYCYDGSATCPTQSISDPGASYVGTLKLLTRSSGSWAPADLGALLAGARVSPTDSDKTWYITSLMLQWAYYDTTFALTPRPMIPQSAMF